MSPFRVLPRATSEALPPPPIYIIIFPSLSCLTPLASPLPHPLRLDTIYSEHPSRFPLLTPHPSPEPISVTSVLFRRAQNPSHVRIKPPQFFLILLIFSSVEPTLSFCAIRLFAFASPSITFLSLSAPNRRPKLISPKRKKKILLIPLIHHGYWPSTFYIPY